jgi:FkbM family methyltransferase
MHIPKDQAWEKKMFTLEMCARTIRHLPLLRKLDSFWNLVTPAYERFLRLIYKNGLKRVINKTDIVYLPHELRHYTGQYEKDVWEKIMAHVRPGDTIADVGAYLGFYAFAFSKRVGSSGKVVAFEPDPNNLAALRDRVKLYKINSKLDLMGVAVGDVKGKLSFAAEGISVSRVIGKSLKKDKGIEVDCIRLDDLFGLEKLDLIKIDVEGYEAQVLLGAVNVLKRSKGYPRAIFIEVHPWAWDDYDSVDQTIVSLLRECGYTIQNTKGETVDTIKDYGEIFAFKGMETADV